MTTDPTLARHRPGRAPSLTQIAAAVVGAVFLLVGILGFIPGITTDYGEMTFAGHDSGAMLLGIFQVSILHNIVHLAFGVVGLVLARRHGSARGYLIVGGLVYLLLWLYGIVVDEGSAANVVPVNDADDWLHLVAGVLMLLLGLFLDRGRKRIVIEPSGRTHA